MNKYKLSPGYGLEFSGICNCWHGLYVIPLSACLLSTLLFCACSRNGQQVTEIEQPVPGLEEQLPETGKFAAASPIGEQCIQCHGNIVRSYRTTGMARAVESIRPGELVGLTSVTDADGWNYHFDTQNGSNRLVETWTDGQPGIEAELLFAIGAGLMDRSYAASIGDLIWFAPVEVITDGEEHHAALAPGAEILPSTRFTTPITAECLACHTDHLPPRGYPHNLLAEHQSWAPTGISCAACHGDVDGHVAWHEDDNGGERRDMTDPILGANRLGQIESVSLCARCHLQGDARFLLEPLARGIVPPGGDMLDQCAVFLSAFPDDEIRFVSHVERLVRSKCFTGSATAGDVAMTCVTCHDPHRSSFDPEERKIVRNACSKCHDSTESTDTSCLKPIAERSGRDCVDCHMRRTGVFDVAHVKIHDHFIRTYPGSPSLITRLRDKESQDGNLALFEWPGHGKPAYADDPGLWMMALMAAGHTDLARPFAEREPGPASSRLPTYYHLRGTFFEAAEEKEEARKAYVRALELDPDSAETSVNYGLLLGVLGQRDEGIAVLNAVIEMHPAASPALRNRAILRFMRGDRNGFVSDLERAFEISPNSTVANTLSDYFGRMGQKEKSARWARESARLDPSYGTSSAGRR